MFREILTRLAESAADTNEDMQVWHILCAPMHIFCVTVVVHGCMCWLSDGCVALQSYVLEIVLTLECALSHLPEDHSQSHTAGPPGLIAVSEKRKHSDLSPLPGECGDMSLGALHVSLSALHVFVGVTQCPACVCRCNSVPCMCLSV